MTAAYYLTANVYFAAFLSSLLLSVLAFWMAITRAASGWQAAVVVIVLFFSRAFVDFSTSGLENPLSYVLLALFVGIFAGTEGGPAARSPRRALTLLWTIASLLYLTRPDEILLVAPMLALGSWRLRQQAGLLRPAIVGLLPAAAWTVFAILYYGFPFPNTAYAKLAMGIDPSELWTQGLLLSTVELGPIPQYRRAPGLVTYVVDIPPRAEAAGFDILLITPVAGDNHYAVGHVLLQ